MLRKYGTSHFLSKWIWPLSLLRLVCLVYFIKERTLTCVLSAVDRVRAYVMSCQVYKSISGLPSPQEWGTTVLLPHLLSGTHSSAGAFTPHLAADPWHCCCASSTSQPGEWQGQPPAVCPAVWQMPLLTSVTSVNSAADKLCTVYFIIISKWMHCRTLAFQKKNCKWFNTIKSVFIHCLVDKNM